ncbi:hypothetical protein BH10PSE16_BH10PSE16_07470 [soil metagenome]
MSQAQSHASQPAASLANKLPAATDPAASPRAADSRPGCVDSTDLLRGQKTVEISHNGSTYRLQATRLGKLILTK